ncbi:hypothetical protein A2961_00205 [Candidatus Woesebacteria bacterium RIFCSPLOWO2_01_FULL_39_21]|uniref:Methyltransferase FkbM domain-containing protein n=1 Tax=Candidatus Woesebacteria bacterium RIFCSPLOWO2_01_FULL_39_21 TaxID=1802519 RepID=A0A1F8BKV8_9BACT|nr:MAG: hypothetical protein A2961_00205 [Candidatus Woesebacteria bacterium RIFCSPLOWO2_01_FULL_39_21]
MRNFKALYHLIENTATILRNSNSTSKRIKLTYIYFCLKIKGILLKNTKTQKLYGHTIHFPNYLLFLRSFEEIFVEKIYDFDPNTTLAPTIIDCGANIGLASLYFKIKYPNSKIICFEPVKETFRYLKMNLTKFSNVTLVNAALSESKKLTYIYRPASNAEGNLESSIFTSRFQASKIIKEKVKGVRLSDYTKSLNVNFLKLDIEGAEGEVLNDLVKHRRLRKIKNIFLEYHSYRQNSLAKILNIFEKNSFKIIQYGGAKPPFWWFKDKFYSVLVFAYKQPKN